jgi:hypothetical protein
MSSAAKLAANAANAQHSTGPRTEEGKTACSKNALTLGLYARRDFIRPEEESDYAKLQADLQTELAPVGVLEQTLADEIRRAIWRLRRCGQVEANLLLRLNHGSYTFDPMETDNPHAEKIQKSVDRGRSQAHRLLHKCTAELRKLQTSRQLAAEPQPATAKTIQRGDPGVGLFRNPLSIARNAACPCNSGKKYKRCCGKDAPPLLQAA